MIIPVAFILALIPFLSFPDSFDRAVIAMGASLILIIESSRLYNEVRKDLHTEDNSEPEDPTKAQKEKQPRKTSESSRENTEHTDQGGDRKEEDQFNVYQL